MEMTMQNALAQYLSADTTEELIAAYESLVENYAADADLPEDADFESGVDAMLNAMGLPSLSSRMDSLNVEPA
jgi:hypothetical protein